MRLRDIVVIGGSAGSLVPLKEIVAGLYGFEGVVLVVTHVPATGKSALPKLLSRLGGLPAHHARDREPLRRGVVLVAPPDYHLVVEQDHVRLSHGARENGVRPAIDVLFRTAARSHGPRVVGIILSGVLDDGTMGIATIKAHGGVTIVQSPEEALFSGMPGSAIANTVVDFVTPTADIAPLLHRLSRESVEAPIMSTPDEKSAENSFVMAESNEQTLARNDGETERHTTALSCPDCHGILLRRSESPLHFCCQIGHAYSPLALDEEQADGVETNLGAAERSLRERAILMHMLADRAHASNDPSRAATRRERAEAFAARASLVRELMIGDTTEPIGIDEVGGDEAGSDETRRTETGKIEADATTRR